MALASDKLHQLAADPKVRELAKKREQDRILYDMSLRLAAKEAAKEGRKEGQAEGLATGLLAVPEGRGPSAGTTSVTPARPPPSQAGGAGRGASRK